MKHRAGCYCPYCGSDDIGLSRDEDKGIVVVCNDCKEPIWSPIKGMFIDYWAVPVQPIEKEN